MLKFFRKVRYKLMEQNNTGKYLKYAMGEIILVVIGILIAVAINDAYNASKNEQKVKTILTQMQEDILADIKDSKRIFRHYIRKDSMAYKVYKDILTVESTPYELRPYDDTVNLSVNRGGYERLMDYLENLPEKYSLLMPRLKRIYTVMQEDITDSNANLLAKADHSRYNRAYTDPNHAEHQLSNFTTKEARQYLLDDPFLKNRTVEYMTAFRGVAFISYVFKIEATELYHQIDTLLGNQIGKTPEFLKLSANKDDIESFLGDYTHLEGLGIRPRLSLIFEDNELFIQTSDNQTQLHWHEDNFFITGRAWIIRLYKNEKGQHFLRRSNGVITQILMKE